MKKTLIALIASMGCAFGYTEITDVTNVTTTTATSSFASNTSVNGTVAITLDVNAFKSLGTATSNTVTNLFNLNGTWEDGKTGYIGMASNVVTGNSATDGLVSPWKYGGTTGAGSAINLDNCFSSIDWGSVVNLTLVMTYQEGPDNAANVSQTAHMKFATALSFLYDNGEVVTIGAEKNDLYRFSVKGSDNSTVVDMCNEFTATGITVNADYVDSYTVYSEYLTLAQAKELSAARVIPEPTTATLSLLALAGLAARRRRK